MSREIDLTQPLSEDDLVYLQQRNRLADIDENARYLAEQDQADDASGGDDDQDTAPDTEGGDPDLAGDDQDEDDTEDSDEETEEEPESEDDNGPTKADLKAILDGRGVDYKSNANKAALQALVAGSE